MKIGIWNLTNALYRGGLENKLWQVARGLYQRGHTVDMLLGRGPLSCPYPEARVGMTHHRFFKRSWVPWGGSRFRKAVERLSMAPASFLSLWRGRYDYIIVAKPYDLPVALAVRKLCGTRVCFISGGGEYFPGFGKLAAAADVFTVPSAYEQAEVEKVFGIRPVVIHNGVDLSIFGDVVGTCLGLDDPNGEVILVTGARLMRTKGHRVVLEALAKIRPQSPRPWRYFIAGAGEEETSLRAEVTRFGLEQEVVFLGSLPQRELADLYRRCHIGIFMSSYEALGNAVGEAMATGLAVVGSNVGGIPEQITEGTGWLLEHDDVEGLARTLLERVGDPDQTRVVARRGQAWIQSHFTWEAYLDQLEGHMLAPRGQEPDRLEAVGDAAS